MVIVHAITSPHELVFTLSTAENEFQAKEKWTIHLDHNERESRGVSITKDITAAIPRSGSIQEQTAAHSSGECCHGGSPRCIKC